MTACKDVATHTPLGLSLPCSALEFQYSSTFCWGLRYYRTYCIYMALRGLFLNRNSFWSAAERKWAPPWDRMDAAETLEEASHVILDIDNWLCVRLATELLPFIYALRNRLSTCFAATVRIPSFKLTCFFLFSPLPSHVLSASFCQHTVSMCVLGGGEPRAYVRMVDWS